MTAQTWGYVGLAVITIVLLALAWHQAGQADRDEEWRLR